MTNKKILADENQEIFQKKFKLLKFSSESEIFSKIGGNLKQGGKCIMVSGGWTPLVIRKPKLLSNLYILIGMIHFLCLWDLDWILS